MTPAINFPELSNLEQDGFTGFVSIASLQASRCRDIPTERGIYLVLYTTKSSPVFLSKSIGGHFKEQDPTVSIAELQDNWVQDTIVVYIGKATNLHDRLWQYMRFGQGKPAPHWGGRYIWQIQGAENLIVCWKQTQVQDPRMVEKELIREFEKLHGAKKPFANLSH